MIQPVPDEYQDMHQRVWSPYDSPSGRGHTRAGLIIPHRDRKARCGAYPLGLDLFRGCGGFSLGFIQAGFRVVGAVEWDEWASLTYMMNLGTYPMDIHYVEPKNKDRLDKVLRKELTRKAKNGITTDFPRTGLGWISKRSNWRNEYSKENTPDFAQAVNDQQVPGVPHFWFGDICKISGREILGALELEVRDLDCVMGGPPCQGFSTANSKRGPDDERNSLVFEFCRLVTELEPRALCIENVPQMVTMMTPEGIPMIDAIAKYLEDGGHGRIDAFRKSLLQTAGLGAVWKESQEIKKAEERSTRAERRREKKERQKQGKTAASVMGKQLALDLEAAS